MNTHKHTHLLYVQARDIQMYNASLQAVHHAITMIMGQEIPHDGRCEVTKTVCYNVGLQWLQEDTLSHHVLHQPSVQLVE